MNTAIILTALFLVAALIGWRIVCARRSSLVDAIAAQLGLSRRRGESDEALRARMRWTIAPPSPGTRSTFLRVAAEAAMCSQHDIEMREDAGSVAVVLPEHTSRADEEAARAALEGIIPLHLHLSVTRGPR